MCEKVETLLGELRQAIARRDQKRAKRLISRAAEADLSAVERVDLAERAAVAGDVGLLEAILDELEPPYTGFAYALSLRYGKGACARLFAGRGLDLLQDPLDAEANAERPESRMARFNLTRKSPNLLLNLDTPSVASEVFAAPVPSEQLIGSGFCETCDLKVTVELVLELVEAGAFDSVVVDDLFRAAVAEADRCLRKPASRDPGAASTLIDFASRLLDLHSKFGFGSSYLDLILGSLIRPQIAPELLDLLCKKAPETVLEAVDTRAWLKGDQRLLRRIATELPHDLGARTKPLVRELAATGAYEELAVVISWPGALCEDTYVTAINAAAKNHQSECALLLLAHAPSPSPHPLDRLRRGI